MLNRFVLAALVLMGGASAQAQVLNRMAVLPLHGAASGRLENPDDEVYQLVVGAFLRTRRFELVERKRLDDVLAEAKFQASGLVDEAGAVKLGRLLGVPWVLIGSYKGELIPFYGEKVSSNVLFRWFTSKLTLNLRLVDVETGKILETFEASGSHKDSTQEKTRAGLFEDCRVKLDRVVANTFPLAGVLLRVDGEKEVMVDLGKKDGIAVGDLFQAVEYSPDVVHPTTGKVIKGAPRPLAELKVMSVGPESCIMKVSGAKGPLKPGLSVESRQRKAGAWETFMDKVIK